MEYIGIYVLQDWDRTLWTLINPGCRDREAFQKCQSIKMAMYVVYLQWKLHSYPKTSASLSLSIAPCHTETIFPLRQLRLNTLSLRHSTCPYDIQVKLVVHGSWKNFILAGAEEICILKENYFQQKCSQLRWKSTRAPLSLSLFPRLILPFKNSFNPLHAEDHHSVNQE